MTRRSLETPFERRERLNLEAAIARSSSTHPDMISEIESGWTMPGDKLHPRPIIPNSQSDEESIQQFTTIASSSISSRLSPLRHVILPGYTPSIDQGLFSEAREPGWSLEKFNQSNLSIDNASSHPNTHSSLPQPSPKSIILPDLSSTSSLSHNNSIVTMPNLLPPYLGNEAIKYADEQQKSTTSTSNLDLSPTADPSLQRWKSPQVSPPKIIPNTPDRTSEPEIEIIAADQPVKISNQQSIAESEAPPQSKKRRKKKTQEETESFVAEDGRGSKKSNLKLDGDGKRVRKQSSAGKASAATLERLSNLDPLEKQLDGQRSKSKDQATDELKKTPRSSWVLLSNLGTDTPQPEASESVQEVQSEVHPELSPKEVHPPLKVKLSINSKPSQPFLQIISSPLSSPSGFSPDEYSSKSKKKQKTSARNKPGPKKKGAAKSTTKKVRKGEINNPLPLSDTIASVTADDCSRVDSTNKPTSPAPAPIYNPEAGLNVSSQVEKGKPPLMVQASTRQSLSSQPENEHPPVDDEIITSKNQSKKSDEPKADSVKPSLQPPQLNQTDVGKLGGNKITRKKNLKGASLAEILASTNPKTKRGLRIGLPREEKHRLHTNINPKPLIQKQVKKKLKLKRGEYDSGEDDRPSKNNQSDSDTEADKLKSRKSAKSNAYLSEEDVDDNDKDHETVLEDEEY